MEAQTENYTGSDCTGNDGATNRVLTLSNTGNTVPGGFLVYASGLALSLTTEYTVVHNNTGTQITFLNRMWDDMEIIVNYYQSVVPGVGTDFVNGPLSDFGVVATRTPVTVTTDFHGNKTYTDGTDEDIDIVFEPYNEKHNLDKPGLTKVYDARIFLKPDATLNKYDKITYDSKVYRVEEVSVRDFDGTAVFKVAILFYIKNE
ncbi:MAG: hypothetical protein ACTSPI_01180 [Candidatus Heimdallarchaeaceae archaeon]